MEGQDLLRPQPLSAVSETIDYPVPSSLDDPRFRWLFDYWLDKASDGYLPGRADIDPVDFPHLLGRLNLIDVLRTQERLRFRYRLWGTKIGEMIGRDYTGRLIEDVVLPIDYRRISRALIETVESCRPHFWRIPVPFIGRDFGSYRRLLLPLAKDGTTVDMLLSLMIEDDGAMLEQDLDRDPADRG